MALCLSIWQAAAAVSMPKPASKAARRSRNADVTRVAIRAAARLHFARENYDRVGLREIAADASVDRSEGVV